MGIFTVNSNSFNPGTKKIESHKSGFQNDDQGPTIIIIAGRTNSTLILLS
jgi:hypothetical protein